MSQSIDWTNCKAEFFNSWNWREIFSAELEYLAPRKTGTIRPLLLHLFTHRKSSTQQQQPSFADLRCFISKHTHKLTLVLNYVPATKWERQNAELLMLNVKKLFFSFSHRDSFDYNCLQFFSQRKRKYLDWRTEKLDPRQFPMTFWLGLLNMTVIWLPHVAFAKSKLLDAKSDNLSKLKKPVCC